MKTIKGKNQQSSPSCNEFVKEKINSLLPIIENIVKGDFSDEILIPEEDDLFRDLFAGFNKLQDKINELTKENEILKSDKSTKGKNDFVNFEKEKFKRIVESAPDGLVIVNKAGVIELINAQTEIQFGYKRNELIGKSVEILIPHKFKSSHSKYRNNYKEKPFVRTMGAGLDLYGVRKDGSEFPVEISLSPIGGGENMLISAAIRDVTDRKERENVIQESLQEKVILLQEIHHRVKNNLQIISSLLNLQSAFIKDNAALELILESKRRVESMALVHKMLYTSKSLSNIPIGEYITTLTSSINSSGTFDSKYIQFKISSNEIYFGINTAIPLGLIINELVSNSCKHAFVGRKEGQIIIDVTKTNQNNYQLSVKDNGIGMPKGFAIKEITSLGLELVHSLAQQLDGGVEILNEGGAQFKVSFKELKYNNESIGMKN